MATDVQYGVHYDEPIQGGAEKVTRQTGLAPTAQVGFDPTPPPPIIQGDPLTVVTRNEGPHVGGHFDGGVFFADHVADTDQILYADGGRREGVSNEPPGLARIAAPLVADPNQPVPPRTVGFGNMLAVEQREAAKQAAIAAGFIVTEPKDSPVPFDVVASDAGSNDPRDMGSAPMVLSASALPVVKKREIVPVTITVVPKAKKGKK